MPQYSRPGWDADQAVTVLYGAHHRALAQMATLLVNDVVVAEEIVEAAFAALHAAWRRPQNGDKALSYLQRAVVRRARSYRVARPDPSRRHLGPPQTGQPDITPAHALLVTALHTLPPRQREALVLRHYAGLPDTQIAYVMGIPARSAGSHVERGTACLRAALERHHTAAAHQLTLASPNISCGDGTQA
jgi:RNA polymerase sigma factor (sigma-70 family)